MIMKPCSDETALFDKNATLAYLDACGVSYELTEHPAMFSMDEESGIRLPHPEACAKSLFVRDDKKKNYFLIVVRGPKRIDLKSFRRDNGTRPLSFASPDDLLDMLKLTPGSVTPLGLLNDRDHAIICYMDADYASDGALIGVHPNDNSATVWLKAADLIGLLKNDGHEIRMEEFC